MSRDLFVREMRHIGVDVSRETRDQLEALVHTLVRWQKAINLVGNATLDSIWVRHVLDSAQLKILIPERAKTLTDLGSGAGFPGLVAAAMRPDLKVTLIESDARKAAFLGEAARRMALEKPPKIVVGRIEAVPPAKADVVTARALAPLGQLLKWAQPHRTDTAICLFHKGKDWKAELTEAMKDWDIPGQPFTSVTDLDAVILRIGQYTAKHGTAAVRDRQPKGRRRQNDDGD
ncbi:16S rRNA (guanine(527)-N(7))-methyltransferase RsmG [Reyranella sp.]|uniref:16S rRNA (guanine(527)-N(7))-methyltransferase RsmG n=1 Tax=Reyranella sp. TaxID=1929291 RepID=UPI0027322465|nr:16S rRNA (guanine(527)-N(7))-methyltransferase RsmG [Reyranella sp.]MDP2376931.1 16S rRNA (guanine(527)-N(7))-methyltransferase RsmG [Reyranella sp.]